MTTLFNAADEGCCIAYDYSTYATYTYDDALCQDYWVKSECNSMLGNYDHHKFYEDETCFDADQRTSSFECR